MKRLQVYLAMLASVMMLEFTVAPVQAQHSDKKTEKKGWSKKGKGALIGGAAGAVGGAVIGGKKGAVIGGAAGTVGGAAIGRKKDRKKDPQRYEQYAGKRD